MLEKRIILVRAINVGGVTLPMAAFREVLGGLGATDVRTYIASGNAICRIAEAPETFDRAVEKALTDRFGWVREVISRSPGELAEALHQHPFDVLSPQRSYVSFLTAPPTPEAVQRATGVPTGEDRWEVIGDNLHIRYANGAGHPSMNTDAVMRRLGVAGTARNLSTVAKLIDLSAGDQ